MFAKAEWGRSSDDTTRRFGVAWDNNSELVLAPIRTLVHGHVDHCRVEWVVELLARDKLSGKECSDVWAPGQGGT